MTRTKAHALLDGHGEPALALVANLETWLARNGKLAVETTGSPDACPIWDEVTVAFLLGPTGSESHPPRCRALGVKRGHAWARRERLPT